MKETEVARKGLVFPVWTVRLEQNEIRSLTTSRTDRQQIFEDVVRVKPACTSEMASSAVDVPESVELVLARRVSRFRSLMLETKAGVRRSHFDVTGIQGARQMV